MSRGAMLLRLFPFLAWPRPSWEILRHDAWAGLSVGLVLVPQAIAYATLAGMPPETGLYAALLPGVVGILWGSSPLLAVGPVALTSLLVFGSLSSLATPGTGQWVTLAIWLSLYAGLIQLLFGVFKLGRIAHLVSMPVMLGFVNAAAVIIILSQLPALAGFDRTSDFAAVLRGSASLAWSPPATAFGVGALLLLVAFRRWLPRWPGILLVTIIGIAASALLGYERMGGSVVGVVPSGLPPLALPSAIPWNTHLQLCAAALILALISFTEAMSSCRVIARRQNQQWDENQEFVGQGLAKIASGFCGAFPVSGSLSRSALNLYAGAKSAWSTLFSTFCVLISLLFLTGFLHDLPRSVLAAMIIVPVTGLLDFRALRRLFHVSRDDATIAAITFCVTLLSTPHLQWGVFAGVSLTMVAFLYRRAHPRIIEVGEHQDGTLRDRARFGMPPIAEDVLAVRIDSALNFLTAAQLERFIVEQVHARPGIRRVLLCAGSINDMDASGADAMESLRQSLQQDGIALFVSAAKKQVWDVLERAGFITALSPDHFYTTDREAMIVLREGSTTAAARHDEQIQRQATTYCPGGHHLH